MDDVTGVFLFFVLFNMGAILKLFSTLFKQVKAGLLSDVY